MPHKNSRPDWLSVTEVLNLSIPKPYLMFWYGKHGTETCERIKRESQELGKLVHQEIEDRFSNEHWTPCGDENVARMVNLFWDRFVIPNGVVAEKLEQTYEDEELKLQGTLDAIIKTDKGIYIADWKTSNQLDKISIPLQLAAYAHLAGDKIHKGMAVRIDKEKSKIEVAEYEDLRPYWQIFLHCLAVAKYQKGLSNA